MKVATKQASKRSVFNWFVPLVIILSAVAMLFFYPAPKPLSPKPVRPARVEPKDVYPINEIATTLVYTFFNGSNKEREEQIDALSNTLNNLKHDPQGKMTPALSALKTSNIQESITTLIHLAHQQEDPREAAKIWINIGNIQNLTSAEQALQAYEKASELDPENTNAWNRQANIYRRLKQFDKAEIAYKKVQLLENPGEVNDALSFANLGLLNLSKGDSKAAEEAFLQALEIYEKFSNDAGVGSTSESLASLYANAGKYQDAKKYYLKVLDSVKKQDNYEKIASIYSALGSLHQSMKDTENAQMYYENALAVSLDNNFQDNIANLYSNLGILAQQNNQLEKSKEYFERSLNLNKDIKRTVATAQQYGNLAILNRKKGKFELAEDFHLRAIEIYQEKNHSNGIISQKTNLGFLYKAWKKPQKACDAWESIMDLLKKNNAERAERIQTLIENTCH